jgi:hypothetical protein
MINYSLYVSGPRIRALFAIANGEYRPTGIAVSGLEHEGLVQFQTAPSEVDGITVSVPIITERGRTVAELIESDAAKYLGKLKKSKPPKS